MGKLAGAANEGEPRGPQPWSAEQEQLASLAEGHLSARPASLWLTELRWPIQESGLHGSWNGGRSGSIGNRTLMLAWERDRGESSISRNTGEHETAISMWILALRGSWRELRWPNGKGKMWSSGLNPGGVCSIQFRLEKPPKPLTIPLIDFCNGASLMGRTEAFLPMHLLPGVLLESAYKIFPSASFL